MLANIFHQRIDYPGFDFNAAAPSGRRRPSVRPHERSSERSGTGAGGGCEIVLLNPNRYPEAGTRRLLPWLAPLVAALAPEAESLSVRFAGDRAMRLANRQFRGKDKTTDVLSFPGEEAGIAGTWGTS